MPRNRVLYQKTSNQVNLVLEDIAMLRQNSSFRSVCVLYLLILNFSFCISIFAQDSPNDEKTAQPKNLKLTESDESIVDTALDLDGNGSYVEIFDSDNLNSINEQVTVSAWIKPTTFPNAYAPIIFRGDKRVPDIKNRSYILYLKEGGFVQLAASPGGSSEISLYSPSGVIELNTWSHIACVIDVKNDFMKLFIDGIKVGRTSFRGEKSLYKSHLPLRIGWTHEEDRPRQSPFVGQIDEVRVWSIARTEADIRSDMVTQLNGDEPGLVAYWNFDEETDGIISDVSPNQNDGKLVGNSKLVDYIRPVSTISGPEQLEKAAIAYEKALTRETNVYEVFRYLAEIYIKTKRFSDAEKVYMRALEADLTQSEYNDAIRALWKLYSDRDVVDKFIMTLEGLKPKMENSSILHELLGDAYKKTDEEEKAELSYKKWLILRKKEVDMQDQSSEYNNLAEKLLSKNLFPAETLELANKAMEYESSIKYTYTLTHAYLVNEMYDDASQLIESFLNAGYYEYTERTMFVRIVKAGKHIKDKDRYVKMLNNLIDTMSHDLPAQLNTIFTLAQFYRANDLPQKAEALIQKTGFITEDAWMILGPFDNIGGVGFNTKYIPENLPQIDTKTEYDGINGHVSWQKCSDDLLNGYIPLEDKVNWSVAYAYAAINSPDERKVEFRFDSDDQGKIWLNGIEVFTHTKTFSAEIDNFIIPVTLYPGKNSILIKVCEETRGSGFYLRITDQNGNPFDDLEIALSEENK